MIYKELIEKYPRKNFGKQISVCRREGMLCVKKTGSDELACDDLGPEHEHFVEDLGWMVVLKRQCCCCDDWIVGDYEAAQKFSEDLYEAMEYIRLNP